MSNDERPSQQRSSACPAPAAPDSSPHDRGGARDTLDVSSISLPVVQDEEDLARRYLEAYHRFGMHPPRSSRPGRFEMVMELGRGGMGRVVEAYDAELGRNVAVKLMRDPSTVTPTLVERFLNEARVTAQLEHPNIVPVHEIGFTAEGELFFVMKRVIGRSLRALIDRAASSEDARAGWGLHRRLSAFVQVCNAIAYAHQRGVLHRDLKPDNVMIGDFGEVVVMDWGVARAAWLPEQSRQNTPAEPPPPQWTVEGEAVGTPGYMSPEQVMGHEDRHRPASDVWSLGVLLFELLTLSPLFHGDNAQDLMLATAKGHLPSPKERAPSSRIPDELDALCQQALDRQAARRPSAHALGQAVEAFLEGSERRAEAQEWVRGAQVAWAQLAKLLQSREQLAKEQRQLESRLAPWAALTEKEALLSVRDRLKMLRSEMEAFFEKTVSSCERALSHDPRNEAAHALLADAYWMRLEEADNSGDPIAARHYAGRVRAHDFGRYTVLLDGDGAISVATKPNGADVFIRRVERSALLWSLGEAEWMGRSPIDRVGVPMGSYLLTFIAQGFQATHYPVHVFRGRHWDAGDAPIPLYDPQEVGAGWAYVPPGPFIYGGDPHAPDALRRQEPWVGGFFIARHPVTWGEYKAFLADLYQSDPARAKQRTPRAFGAARRAQAGLSSPSCQPTEGRPYPLDDDLWCEDWPVTAISWGDATAYAAWLSEQHGVAYRLPRELEWEKAARGVDGRFYPWGEDFDPSLCCMRDSRPNNHGPCPAGSFPDDVSIYGVFDMAGLASEWCVDPIIIGQLQRRVVRGGAWTSDARACRLAARTLLDVNDAISTVGFRLVRGAPMPKTR